VKFDGRDCIFIWDPINPIGENVHFKDYYVQVYSSAYSFTQAANGTGFSYEGYVTDPRFDLTYDLNKKIFGTIQARFLFQVKGRSIYNTYSPTWAQLTAASEEPEDVSVINESQRAQEVFFYWDRNPNDERYRVQVYSSAYTPTMALAGTGYVYEEYVSVPNFTVTISDLVNWFGVVQKRFGIQVKSVNSYNVESNNWKFYSFEADAPPKIQTISHIEKPTEVIFSWDRIGDLRNLIDRGDCEDTTAPMVRGETSPCTGNCTYSRASDQVYSGSYSWKMTKTSGVGGGYAWASFTDNQSITDMHGLIPGETYTIKCMMRTDSSTPSNAYLEVKEYYGGAWHWFTSARLSSTNQWEELSITFTINRVSTGIAISIVLHTDEPSDTSIWVDDVKLYWNGGNVSDREYHLQLYSSAYSATVASGEGYSLDTYTDVPNFTFTRDDNINLFGSLQSKFNIQVKRVNYFGKESDNWRWYEYENRPPATPTNLSTYPGFRSVYFTWSKCTAADFEKYIIRTREGTGSYGNWEDTITNAYLAELSSTAQAGTRIGIEVKAVDNLGKQSGSLTGSAETITVKTGDAQAFNIIPSDSEGRSVEYLRVLYDTVLSGSAVNISAGDWIQYEYPVEYVYNASTIWTNKDFGLYLGYYDNNEKVWKYLAGDSSHGLSGGKLVEYSTEASAQSNYYHTSKDANGKVNLPWPFSRQSNKVRLYNYNTADVDVYEWKNNVFVLADEIIAGELQLSKGITIAQSATADYGAIFDKDKLEFFNNGLSTIKIEKTGRARFGATGQPNISIEPSGSVVIDQEIIAEKVTSDLISSRIAELGNNHVRIDENGIFVSDANANLPKSGDTRVFINAINRKISFDRRVDPILIGTAENIWGTATNLLPRMAKLDNDYTVFAWALTGNDYHPYQKPIYFKIWDGIESSIPTAITSAVVSENKSLNKFSYDLTDITGNDVVIVSEEAEDSVPENLIGFFESDPGSYFIYQNGTAGELDLIDKFIKGSNEEGSEGGSDNHGHSHNGSSGNPSSTTNVSQLRFVAVGLRDGSDAYILNSKNGTSWTERTINRNSDLRGICYSDDDKQFVAVGYLGWVVTSPDGINWTERVWATYDADLNDVCYSSEKGLYVAVGDDEATDDALIITSSDGITWTERTTPKRYSLFGVCYGNGKFVAVGEYDDEDSYILTSTDGITWTEQSNPGDQYNNLYDICYGNGKFVACGGNGVILVSTDGSSWTKYFTPKYSYLQGICYSSEKGLYVAVGNSDTYDAYIITSTDGINWTERSNPKAKNLQHVCYDSDLGMFVAVGNNDGSDAYILTSTDGITWTERSNPKNITLRAVCIGPSRIDVSYTHTHTINHSHTSVSNLPPYKSLLPYRCSGKKLSEGMILFYDGESVPDGWELYTDLIGRFLRGGSTVVTGGSTTHSHATESYTTDTNTSSIKATPMGNTVSVAAVSHNHSYSHGHSAIDHQPPYITLIPVKASSKARLVPGIIGFFRGNNVPDGWILCDGNNGTKNLIDFFIKGDNTSGNNGGSSTHTHSYSGSSNESSSSVNVSSGSDISVPVGTHTHTTNHSHSESNIPVNKPLLACMYVGLNASNPRKCYIEISRIKNPDSSPVFYTTTVTSFVELTGSTYTKYPIIKIDKVSNTEVIFSWLNNRKLYLKRMYNMTGSSLGSFGNDILAVTGDNIGGYDITYINNNKTFVTWYDRNEKKIWGRYINVITGEIGTAINVDTLTEHIDYKLSVEAMSSTAVVIGYSLGSNTKKGRLKYVNNANGTPTIENEVDIFTLSVPEGISFINIKKRVTNEVIACISDNSNEKNIYFQKVLDLSTTGQKGEIMYVTGGDELGDFLIWSETTAIAAYGMDNGNIEFINFYNLDATAEWEVRGTIEIV